MSVQGGEPSFRVNRWDVIAVLFASLASLFGVIAGTFRSFMNLAVGHSGFLDDRHEFREQVLLSIDMIDGVDDGG